MRGEFLQATLIDKRFSNLFRDKAVVRCRTLLLLAALLLSGLSALAQTRTGGITGLVTDASGGVVPKASVKITNVDTGVALDMVTDSAGLYDAPELLPGHYSVAVTLTGFQSQSKIGLVLSISQTLTVNFTLEPGGQVQKVTVVGTAEQLVDTTKSTMGDVITQNAVADLPLNGRNFMNLVPLSAGVAPPPQGSNKFYTNGSRGAGTGFLIDGADVTSPSIDPPRVLPNLEAIGEFSVITSNFTAEYGRALGGVVNTHIKSGTNGYHGSVFEYVRNTSLDARNFFDIPNRLPYHQNQFGGALGGPLVKNKLFIFGDYQGTRIISGTTVHANAPTPAERGGNFSDLLPGTTIYDPLTFPRTQFMTNGVGNVIPPTRFDPAAAQMVALFPNPNATYTAASPYNYIVPQNSSNDTDGFDIRADYNATGKDRFSVIVVWNNNSGISGDILNPQLNGNLIGGGHPIGVRARDYTLNYTRTITPSMVNEFTFAWTRSILFANGQDGQQYNTNLGIPGLNDSPSDGLLSGMPLFDLASGGYPVFGGSAGTPSTQNHNIPQISDTLSWIKGRHAFKAGYVANFRQYNLNQSLFTRGLYVFLAYPTASYPANALSGGNAIASVLLGYPYEIRRQILPALGERIKEDGAYFQDDYKMTKRLTLNLGARWDLFMPSTEEFNRLGDFNPSTVTVRVAGQNGNSRSTLDVNNHNFGPHVGFAYQLTSDAKTVVRGGYAISYINLVTQEVGTVDHRLIENPPVSRDYTTFNFPLGPLPPAGISVPTVSAGYPAAGQFSPGGAAGILPFQNPQSLCCGAFMYYIPQSQPMPYQEQFGLDIQRALPGNILLDVGYDGSRGVHLTGLRNINQAPPGATAATARSPISANIGEADALENRESSIYHSLQVKLERRFSAGFYLFANYTWSHSIDNGSESATASNNPIASSALAMDSFHYGLERGNSDFDLRHRAVVNFVYELPFGTGKKYLTSSSRVADAFLGGWQVNGIFQGQSGSPFETELANGSSDINSGPGGPVRPYLIGNPKLSSGQSITEWYNVAAFAVPGQSGTPADTFGNAGRNILFGPDLVNFDFSMFKTFKITERLKLEFRSEFFNLFNHPDFALPNQAVDQPQGGHITNTVANPRQVQFALKLLF